MWAMQGEIKVASELILRLRYATEPNLHQEYLPRDLLKEEILVVSLHQETMGCALFRDRSLLKKYKTV